MSKIKDFSNELIEIIEKKFKQANCNQSAESYWDCCTIIRNLYNEKYSDSEEKEKTTTDNN